MTLAIKVENLSKAYQIGQIGTGTVSRDIERWFVTRILGREDPFLRLGQVNDRTVKGDTDVVWSLKDINLNFEQGDVVGIIGRNGAGKSTLLKLLSRITSPTTGSIKIKGRVASLLEVGTGFHPELTGRENTYLNGSILGMRKKEIDRKLDEIVEFSGIERYIDTPVKRYSSGMSVRLAFAVAAHLESEILIVDEVLAVGDAEFQQKCLGKMEEVGQKDGRTILFVSHNMGAIHALCRRGILIETGGLAYDGNVVDCVGEYSKRTVEIDQSQAASGLGPKAVSISGVRINGDMTPVISPDRGFEVSVNISAIDASNPRLILLMHNSSGQQVVHRSFNCRDIGLDRIRGSEKLVLTLPEMWLANGVYSVWFKLFVSGARVESERILLEVRDTFGRRDNGVLSPEIGLRVQPRNEVESKDLNGEGEISIPQEVNVTNGRNLSVSEKF